MNVLLTFSLIGIIGVSEAGIISPSTWALLVAGSRGWGNYRHQADVCHAYQILIKHGVNPDRIIVMMYDDVANNRLNPRKGQLINKPDGPDVYKGVKIDYREEDVNVKNFKNILLGNKGALKGIGTGRVLESGPKDDVFINFVDHGATGLLAFPSESLYANDFIAILKEMKNKQRFSKMVLYIEACESGSMFDNLLGHHDNILVSTAAAPDESSYAWYCETWKTCLGDLYSIAWMNRMDKLNFSESLFEQFDAVRTEVLSKSHVNLYGDYRLGFTQFGNLGSENDFVSAAEDEYDQKDSGVSSRDVPLYFAQQQLKMATSDLPQKKNELETIIKGRDFADSLISNILEDFTNGNADLRMDLEYKRYRLNKGMFGCYKSVISSFESNCYKVTKHTYFLKHLYKFANICVKGYDENEVRRSVEKICNQQSSKFELIV
uniref:legumain n=1 Tax=Riptortus pedestris TaxID=329032 RepID=R4WP47_RIPPE|nr:gpi-anchor transamidase [Riptortus pedestris]